MKVRKDITIDLEIAQKLEKFDNASSIINNLLKDYLNQNDRKGSEIEKKVAFLRDISKKTKVIRKEVKVFKSIERIGFDTKCINWCLNSLENDFEDSLNTRIDNYIFVRRLKIKNSEFKRGFELIEKNVGLFKKEN